MDSTPTPTVADLAESYRSNVRALLRMEATKPTTQRAAQASEQARLRRKIRLAEVIATLCLAGHGELAGILRREKELQQQLNTIDRDLRHVQRQLRAALQEASHG